VYATGTPAQSENPLPMVMFAYVPPDALIAKAPALNNTKKTFSTSFRFIVFSPFTRIYLRTHLD
jgi:hypothetical protein